MNQLVEVINQDVVVQTGNLVVTKTLIGQAEDLAAEHEAFNTNYVIGGRKALYSLLGKIAVLVERFDTAVDKDDLIKIVRKNLQEQFGIKTQENTSDVTVLVRYITRADRKTAHVYARAIETAKANQIAPAQFAGYLEQAGGVERIRAEGADSVDSDLGKRVGIARMHLNARKVFPITSFKLKSKGNVQEEGSSDLKVLICSESEGRQYVLAKLPIDSTLEKKVLDGLLQQLPNDLRSMSRQVTEFHKKAIKKKSKNTFKAIVKKRPVLAAGMLRIKRIRNLTAQSNNQSI
jgi:hypothetical protein